MAKVRIFFVTFVHRYNEIMESLRKLFKIGNGPSSSHTLGPKNAAEAFLLRGANREAAAYRVTLYGSLAATGKGHFTDRAILSVLEPVAPTEIVWEFKVFLSYHPNGMMFEALAADGAVVDSWTIYSVGGGTIANEESEASSSESIYPHKSMAEIQSYCEKHGVSYWEYVLRMEGDGIMEYLEQVWDVMCESIHVGLNTEGVLEGGLGVRRKASDYYIRAQGYMDNLKSRGTVFAYALAVAEVNASGGRVVTAPTFGSCGVVPSVVYHIVKSRNFQKARAVKALATAGLFGNIAKKNASISGAEVGCQGEVGVACAMAAAAACQLFGGSPAQVEYAAEMGLEHHLGLTCDPVCGLVQIPCIERNAYAAARALDSNIFSMFSDGKHRVSYDKVVDVMRSTGHDMPSLYKETSEGGLALHHEPEEL